MSPLSTAIESVRVAVGPDGSIYSIYALGALGSYSLNIGEGDLRIAKFTPQGKFEKAFGESKDSTAIYVDASGRVIVSESGTVKSVSDDAVPTPSPSPKTPGQMMADLMKHTVSITTFTADRNGNIYTIADNTVSLWRLKE